jgi:choline kinase
MGGIFYFIKMKAIIACAGLGSRISSHIEGKPKSTLELPNGKPLLVYTIEVLKDLGFNKIVVIVGYKKEIIEDLVKPFKDLVKIYFNPFFEVCGSAGSFFIAKEEFDGSSKMLLMNGDSFYTKEIYEKLLKEQKSPILLIDKSRKEIANTKVVLDENDCCIEYDKDITEWDAESCDLFLISAKYSLRYKIQLEELCQVKIKTGWWENAMTDFCNKFPVYTKDIGGAFWRQIDYLEDYEKIIHYFKNNENT